MQKALFLSLTIAAVALAGCTDEPASGEFLATIGAADYSAASVTIAATAASNSYPAGDAEACQADAVFGQDPTGQFPFACSEATSTVSFTEGGATLPMAGEPTGYTMVLMHPNGDLFPLGALEHHGEGHYDYPETVFDGQDFSNAYQVQIRFGEAIVATAPGTGGAFELAKEMAAMSADVTFMGPEITVELKDAPAVGPFVVWLVSHDEEANALSHDVSFILGGNSTTYTLSETEGNVGDYKEFHVHVGGSSINVLKVQIPHNEE